MLMLSAEEALMLMLSAKEAIMLMLNPEEALMFMLSGGSRLMYGFNQLWQTISTHTPQLFSHICSWNFLE